MAVKCTSVKCYINRWNGDPASRPRGVCYKGRVKTHTHEHSYARENRTFDIADACVRKLRRDAWRSFRQQNEFFVIKTTKSVTFLNCYTFYIRANTWHCPQPISVWAKISFLLISLTDVRCNSITETKTALLFLLAISRSNRVYSNMEKTYNEMNMWVRLASLHRDLEFAILLKYWQCAVWRSILTC